MEEIVQQMQMPNNRCRTTDADAEQPDSRTNLDRLLITETRVGIVRSFGIGIGCSRSVVRYRSFR